MTDEKRIDDGIDPAVSMGSEETVSMAALTNGNRFGRYRIMHRIGSGGMGTVYTAVDPTLDRTVALKVLHERVTAEDAEQRLLREAQAMARLSHPNVVTVHDAGMEDGRPYVAMELVDGSDLQVWLRRKQRGWREIVDGFIEAGRGLAAAHEAGLIHRDFKPKNVMVGTDGRMRVTDFGLARAADLGPTETRGARAMMRLLPQAAPESSSPLETPLTQDGIVVGTPAYMAPEQALEGRADRRADQYAFCVSLYAALFGGHPLGTFTDMSDFIAKIERYEIAAPESTGGVPNRIVAAIMKGLSRSPDDRFEDMDALLAELQVDPTRNRRRWRVFGAVMAALVVIAAGAAYVVHRKQLCTGGKQQLAQVWNEDRRSRLENHFSDLNSAVGRHAATTLIARLDSYGSRWSDSHREACIATRIRGEQSESLLDRQMACLRSRLSATEHLLALLTEANRELAANSLDAVLGLPAPEVCTESASIVEREPPPSGEINRQRHLELDDLLAVAEAEKLAGDYETSLHRVDQLLPLAREFGYRPLLARALILKGFVEAELGRADNAGASLAEAYSAAELGRDDLLGATAALNLMWVKGYMLVEFDEAERWSELALAKIDRLGGDDRILAEYSDTRTQVLIREGRYREAIASQKKAVDLVERDSGPDSLDTAMALTTMGNALSAIGDYQGAVESYERSLVLKEAAVGLRHPTVGFTLTSLAQAVSALGDHERSIELCERALAIHETAFGPDHPNLGVTLNNLAFSLDWVERYSEAKKIHQRSIDIVTKAWGVNHTQVGISYLNLSSVEYRSGDLGAAIDAVRRAEEVFEATVGAEHHLSAYAANNLGVYLMKSGEAEEGVIHLERALAIRDNPDTDPALIAETRYNLGRAQWEAGQRQLGRRSVTQAEREVAALEEPDEDLLADIREWLGTH